MGRQIDFSKPLSDDDEAWLRERGRGWQVDEAERVLADEKEGHKAEGGPSEIEWTPSNRPPADFFDEPGPNPRQVPRPVGEREELTSPDLEGEGEDVEEVAPEDLTVEELKDELHARELPVSGNKDELVKRLKKALKEEDK
jgi:hypothetical protein